jgi:hypothetical protein
MASSFREQFLQSQRDKRNENIDALNQFLTDLADNLVDRINKSKLLYGDNDKQKENPYVEFTHVLFKEFNDEQVRALDGYKKLMKACGVPEMDVCLGIPGKATYRAFDFTSIVIFPGESYAHSTDALTAAGKPPRLASGG